MVFGKIICTGKLRDFKNVYLENKSRLLFIYLKTQFAILFSSAQQFDQQMCYLVLSTQIT